MCWKGWVFRVHASIISNCCFIYNIKNHFPKSVPIHSYRLISVFSYTWMFPFFFPIWSVSWQAQDGNPPNPNQVIKYLRVSAYVFVTSLRLLIFFWTRGEWENNIWKDMCVCVYKNAGRQIKRRILPKTLLKLFIVQCSVKSGKTVFTVFTGK